MAGHGEQLFDLRAGMQNRAVIASAEVSPDALQRQVRQAPRQVHAYLTGEQDLSGSDR